MNDLSANEEREVDNTLEADHEYEILDKCDQAYDEVKVPPPKSESVQLQAFPLAASDDYMFTQCPAYVSTTTTNNHVQLQAFPLAASDGYKFTQCPAYVSTATTNNHGNTNRSEYDVPSIPSTTAAQDDQNEK